MTITDNYTIKLQYGGPPGSLVASSLSSSALGKLEFSAETLSDMRAIPSNKDNWRCDLLGYEAPFDGYLQGRYYWIKSSDQDNSNSIIRPNDYVDYLWRKIAQ